MNVEVLKLGKRPEYTAHEVACRHCASLLRFWPYDAKLVRDHRDGDYYEVRCPVCKNTVTKAAS